MEKQDCLFKHLICQQSQQSPPSSQRKDVPFHTLVYISIGFAKWKMGEVDRQTNNWQESQV